MGGFAGLLGHAAAGFEGARQEDLQRQFADEQNRRSMAGELMRTIALDPTQHPDVRNAFLQSYLGLAQQPFNKPFNFGKTFDPLFQMMSQYRQQAMAAAKQPQQQTTSIPGTQTVGPPPPPTFSPGASPLPAGTAGPTQPVPPVMSGGGQSLNLPEVRMNVQGPPKPPDQQTGMLTGYNEQTGMLANRIGAETGAQAGAEMKTPVYSWGPNGQLQESFVSGTGQPIGATIGNAFNPIMGRMAMNTLHPIQVVGPDGQSPIPAMQDKLGIYGPQGMVYDENMQPIPNAVMFAPSLVTKTTEETKTPMGGLPTSTSRTTGPVKPQGGTVPTKPGAGGGTVPTRSGGAGGAGGGLTPGKQPPAAVLSAADQIMMYGLPSTKLDNAQNLAIQWLKSQGVDPSIAATMATKTMADKGRSILPLIAEARQLIAANPNALGPLSGRWSELMNKVGTLDGPAKQLAGDLISIYSIAGGMHGWRAIQVAQEFEKTYGNLSGTPSSLNSGLDALEHTANTVIKTGYPGGSTLDEARKNAGLGGGNSGGGGGGGHQTFAEFNAARKQKQQGAKK